MQEKQKIPIINLVLIIMLILCLIIGIGLIILAKSKTKVELIGRSGDSIKSNYASTANTSKTWDISLNKDESVIATLTEDETLTISGTGEMQNWTDNADTDWHEFGVYVRKVIIEEGVTNIGEYAFYKEISMESIEIPSSVTNIKASALSSCNNLENIEVNENNPNYIDDNGILYTKDKTKIVKYPPENEDIMYTVPNGVTIIGEYAFDYCENLVSIELPDTVTNIEVRAFYWCTNLANINIPDGVTSIGNHAFAFDDCLGSIEIPDSVTKIEHNAFRYCEYLVSVKLSKNITILEKELFAYCGSLTSINIPSSVTSIENDVFYACNSLLNIEVEDDNLNYMDENGVLYTKDQTTIIKYPKGRTESHYTISKKVKHIGQRAFDLTNNLESIDIPNGVVTINVEAFRYCRSVKSIAVPSSVVAMGDKVFYGITNLTLICKTGSRAQTYAMQNSIKYQTDDVIPTLESEVQLDSDAITVSVTANDETAGIDKGSYKYYIKEENGTYGTAENDGSSHMFTDLKSNTKYIIKVEVLDKVGNKASQEKEITTGTIYNPNKIESTTHVIDEENFVIKGIQPKTTVEEIKQNLQCDVEYEILDLEGNVATGNIGTNYKIKLPNGTEYTLIVWGDYTGDGIISVVELARASRIATQEEEPELKEMLIVDVSMDGNIKISDLAALSRLATE